jgi:hypothetical protein
MRKQVYDLTAAAGTPLSYVGLLVVRATLTLANGTRYPGSSTTRLSFRPRSA